MSAMHAAKWVCRIARIAGALIFACPGAMLAAQSSVPTTALMAELTSLSAQAATVFVGQIVSIQHRGSVVEMTFRVEQRVRGAAAQTVVLREWAGLWAPGVSRYTVGQRALAFLHGASGAGLNTPVHGAEGLVPVVVQGADQPELLDIRRVAASVVRAPGTALPTGDDAALELADVLNVIAGNAQKLPATARVALPVRGRSPLGLLTADGPASRSGSRTFVTPIAPEVSDAHR